MDIQRQSYCDPSEQDTSMGDVLPFHGEHQWERRAAMGTSLTQASKATGSQVIDL